MMRENSSLVPTHIESSALVSLDNSSANAARNSSDQKPRKGRPYCDHCRRPGHSCETCWQLHPELKQSRNPGNQEAFAKVASGSPFNKEQLEALQQLISQASLKPSSTASSNVAHQGTALHVLADDTTWIVDSGASDHMTGNKVLFSSLTVPKQTISVTIADGSKSTVKGIGVVKISENITLNQVFYIPNLHFNLLSVRKLNKDLNCFTVFNANSCFFQDRESRKMIGCAELQDGLYRLPAITPNSHLGHPTPAINSFCSKLNKDSELMLLYYQLGHPNFLYLKQLFPSLFHHKNTRDYFCDICQFSKHTRVSYSPRPYKPSSPFTTIHSDIWGPSKVNHLGGHRWFLLLVDEHTRLCWVYLMKSKSKTIPIIKQFHTLIKNQFQTSIKQFHSDNGKEFVNTELHQFFSSHGIIHTSSCIYTPQ